MTLELISHHLCPYVQRAAIVLSEKNVAFERIDIDLSNKPDWFKAISPLGKTPLLRIDGKDVIFESAVICEYLDETEAPRLHPADALVRAQHRGWIEFASATLNDIAGLYNAAHAEAFETKRVALQAKFVQIEAVLRDEPYFAGQSFCIVDAAFAPVFRYFDTFEGFFAHGVFAGLPKTLVWRAALADRASVKGAVDAGYPDRLAAFLVARGSHISRMMTLHPGREGQ